MILVTLINDSLYIFQHFIHIYNQDVNGQLSSLLSQRLILKSSISSSIKCPASNMRSLVLTLILIKTEFNNIEFKICHFIAYFLLFQDFYIFNLLAFFTSP